jgi:hypothetical protein
MFSYGFLSTDVNYFKEKILVHTVTDNEYRRNL